jgi:hypothetical protein
MGMRVPERDRDARYRHDEARAWASPVLDGDVTGVPTMRMVGCTRIASPSRLTRREATAGRWERVATSGLGSLHLAGGLSQPIAAPDRGGLGTTADRQSGRVYGREDRGEPPQASCGPEAPHHPLPLAQQHMRIRNPWHDLPPATPEPRRVFRRRIGVDTTC